MKDVKSRPSFGDRLRTSTLTGNATTPPPSGVDPAMKAPKTMATAIGHPVANSWKSVP